MKLILLAFSSKKIICPYFKWESVATVLFLSFHTAKSIRVNFHSPSSPKTSLERFIRSRFEIVYVSFSVCLKQSCNAVSIMLKCLERSVFFVLLNLGLLKADEHD